MKDERRASTGFGYCSRLSVEVSPRTPHSFILPTTTVHGRTRQLVTRPLITYGSCWAKDSATERSVAWNMSSDSIGRIAERPAQYKFPAP